jgi:PBP1b-binding outer membrane lipoprotein LpoB
MKKVTIIALALLFSSCVHEETVEVSPEKVNKVREVAQVAMAKLRGELMKNFKKR